MSNLFEAVREAVRAAINRWHFVRYMQRGGNPDDLPF